MLKAQGGRQRQASANPESSPTYRGFAVFWLLHREGVAGAERVGREAAKAFEQYPHWQRSAGQEREVRFALSKPMLAAGIDVDQAAGLTYRILDMLRRKSA